VQVHGAMLLLKEQAAVAAGRDPEGAKPCAVSCAMALEAVARLGWSDDEVREMVAATGVQSCCCICRSCWDPLLHVCRSLLVAPRQARATTRSARWWPPQVRNTAATCLDHAEIQKNTGHWALSHSG
jgi:hypothetical protein